MLLTSYLSHCAWVQIAGQRLGIEATARLDDFTLQLRQGDDQARWRPNFLTLVGEGMAYTSQLTAASVGFAGWWPYALRRWPLAADKAVFKREAARLGLRTLAATLDPARIGGPFLVKGTRSSFGQGIRGPWRERDPLDGQQQLQDGEYYENFVYGVSAKAWCWDGRCLALELVQPTTVTGDGRSTLRRLVEALPHSRGRHDWALVGNLARFCGVDGLDAVVAEGREVPIEYRYGSVYRDPLRPSVNALEEARPSGLSAQFDEAAARLQPLLPPFEQPAASLYTLDAVVDAEGLAWFLEMNCNPTVHPHAYEAMFLAQFPGAVAPESAPTQVPALEPA